MIYCLVDGILLMGYFDNITGKLLESGSSNVGRDPAVGRGSQGGLAEWLLPDFDPSRRVIARFLPPADLSIDTGCLEAWCQSGIEQQVIDA